MRDHGERMYSLMKAGRQGTAVIIENRIREKYTNRYNKGKERQKVFPKRVKKILPKKSNCKAWNTAIQAIERTKEFKRRRA